MCLERIIILLFAAKIALTPDIFLQGHSFFGHIPTVFSENVAALTRNQYRSVTFPQPAVETTSLRSTSSSSDSSLDQVEYRVRIGDRDAAKYLIFLLPGLDGGDLEDAMISLGQFSDKKMVDFLVFSKDRLLSNRDFESALTMIPLSISDDACAQINILRYRRRKIHAIDRDDLIEPKRRAIGAISGFISEINSHMTARVVC